MLSEETLKSYATTTLTGMVAEDMRQMARELLSLRHTDRATDLQSMCPDCGHPWNRHNGGLCRVRGVDASGNYDDDCGCTKEPKP